MARIRACCLGLTLRFAQVKLPLDPGVVLLDIGFTETDPNHGAPYTVKQLLLWFSNPCVWHRQWLPSIRVSNKIMLAKQNSQTS